MLWLAGLVCLLLATSAVRADRSPTNCAGSALNISLFTSIPDVHIGDTLYYSVNVSDGIAGSGRIACDATSIQAWVVTPDGKTNSMTLVRTNLSQGEADYYPDVVSYVVRAQDVQPNGTLLASATDTGIIHQNIVNGIGGSSQEVNTEVNLPCVLLTAHCVGGVGENGSITFTGTVTNCGNNTLIGVTVTNFVNNGALTVLFPTNLALGQSASFSGSWVPLNPCGPNPALLTVRASDEYSSTPRLVTNFTTINCQNTLTPGIKVTKSCPAQPISPGQLLTFSGSVSNTGNVTLTNIVVVNNQPAANTQVFTLPSLAPGAVANFTGSYLAPTNCSVTDTLTARASSICGVAVTNTASATCSILTTPQITVTALCPPTPILPGGSLTYSGTVQNTGNITLTNVAVVSDRPAANTKVFTAATMAPGASSNFTGTYTVPTNACSVTTTFTGTGAGICTLATVTNIVATSCAVTTAPAIAVTLACPAVSASTGGLITYSGKVTNSGNVTLINVFVVNNQPAPNTTVLGPLTLAPGAVSNFTASFTAPANACSVSSTVTATGSDYCNAVVVTNSASATCALTTTPRIVVTEVCPVTPAAPGGLLTYSGTVSNAGNIALTNVVVLNNLSGATPVFTTAALAPGALASFTGSFLAPATCSATSVSTATGRSICGVAVTNTVSATCSIPTVPALVVTQTCPITSVLPGGLLTYSGSVSNAGNVTLTNVVVLNNLSGATPVLKAAKLVPGAVSNFTGSYLAPTNCSTPSTSTATGRSICGEAVTNTVTTTCPITTTPLLVVTQKCPANSASPGGLLTYSGTVSNAGNIMLTNVVVLNNLSGATPVFTAPTLPPRAVSNFTGSYLAPANCSTPSTSTATGRSTCGVAVTNTVSATCPILTAPALVVTQTCPITSVVPGGLLTYSGTVSNSGNITLTNVVVLNNLSGATPVFTTATLAPGAVSNFTGSYLTPTNCSTPSTSTATGRSVCGVAVTNTVTSTCPILTAPALVVTQTCPITSVFPGGTLTYGGTVSNAGNVTLTNVVVLNNLTGATPVFTAATLAPGAAANFTGSYVAPTNCSSTSTSTATGRSICGVAVTNTASTTCPITTAPLLVVTQNCPANPVSPGSLLTYSGTVSNAGNIMLTNVVVLNNLSGATPVFTAATLPPRAVSNFTGSYLAPANYSDTSTSTATGRSTCGLAVTNTTSATCSMLSAPAIAVTQTCPSTSVVPGGILTYSGIVSNAGNIALTNVVVLNNMSGATPVFTAATLAPGAASSFTGSYVAPANCFTPSTSTATGRSICGVAVTNSASATCPILTTPAIEVTQTCPITNVLAGGTLTYSGTVSNAGNITLTNIIVVSDRPASNTVIFTLPALAPGATTNFTGSYQVPSNCCVVWSTVQASGQGCAGVTVTDTDTRTCTVLTLPRLVVTKICAPGVLRPGDLLTYTGIVSNAGNVTLLNVTVVNSQSPSSPLLGPVNLVPGEWHNYSASYIVPPDFCGADTVTASGLDLCTFLPVVNSVTATCPITTTPLLAVTMNCPLLPTPRGGLFTYTGSVGNPGNVTLVNVFVVDNQPSNNTPVLGPITLAPGVSVNFTNSYIAPGCCCIIIDTLTARGQDRCSSSNVAASATAVCPVLTIPSIAVVQNCPPNPIPMGSVYMFSGYVTNTGDSVLTNVLVFGPQGTNTPVLGPIELAAGESEFYFGSYTVPSNICSVSVAARGQAMCNGNMATSTASCPVATTPLLALTQVCPVSPAIPGGLLTYSGTVSNAGNIALTNVVVLNNLSGATPIFTAVALAPGAVSNFTGSYLAPANCSSTSTSTATGRSICGVAVTNAVSTTCPITTTPLLALTQVCPVSPTIPGGLLTYSGTVSNAGNVALTNVVVLNNLSGATPVFTTATLAPGAVSNFTGSYLAPANCFSTSTSAATGRSICGVSVTNTVSTTCPITTAPLLALTQVCPVSPAIPGGLLTYSGTVSNAGNIALTNVVVLNNLSGATPVFTAAALAPGAVSNFTGSYLAPANCSTMSTSTATGRSICGVAVTNAVSTTCPITTAPGIAITQNCPPNPVSPGGLLTYSGTVSNAGNIALTNVVVRNNLSGATPVFTAATLAPGAAANFTGSYLAPANCSTMSTSTATGQSICGVAVTNAVSTTCPITTAPLLALTQVCPVSPTIPGGLLTYRGTVSNAGNIALTNVVVLNNLSGATPVFTAAALAPGAVSNFTGSYLAPTNCSSTSTSTATGRSICGLGVTNTVSTACPITTTPGIAITQNCPPTPVTPGGLLTYSGSIHNAGNITLTNVAVRNNLSGATPVLIVASLAPGDSATFTGSYTAPASGFSTSTSTATAASLCGVPVTNSASASCPILTSPGIAVTKACPPVPVTPGGTLVFTGTITNEGNVILTNVMVVDNQPAANTPVLGPITLAPGAGTNFTGSYTAPLDACATADTLIATGNDNSTGIAVTNIVSVTCPITTTPAIAITETCPPGPVTAGSSVTFGGSVNNSGNITLTNVLVFSSQPTNNTPVLGPITLAPGASQPFTGSYIATGGSNPATNTTILTNSSSVITTNTNSVIVTNNISTVTTNVVTPTFGTIDPVTDILTDRFNVPANLHGLMYADQDENWGPTLFYATRHPGSGADQFDTISTIPPSAGVTTDRFALTSTNYDALTLSAPDVGYGSVNFYYLRHDNSGLSTFGVIKAAGASSSADLWALSGTGYNALAFAAPDLGYGANLFYSLRQDNTGHAIFGTINPTPGGSETDRYTVGTNFDSLVFVPSAVSTWGTAIFAYLRHTNTGSIIGTIDPVTHVATDRINLGTNFLNALTFTATDVGYGPNLFYYLRPGGTNMTTNTVTNFTTNIVITFTTNTLNTYTTNNLVSFTPTNTVTAFGTDTCQARTVDAAANCLGPVTPPPLLVVLGSPHMANGLFSLPFPTVKGKSYTVQYKNTLNDPTWTVLETVVGTGGNLSIKDAAAAQRPARFYRVIVTP